jgi:lipoprotein NlpI
LYPSDHRLRDPDGLFCSQAGAGVFSAGAGKSTDIGSRGDADATIAACTKLIYETPLGASQAAAYIARGLPYETEKDYDRAIADYSEAIQLGNKSALMYDTRGRAYLYAGALTKALADFDKASKLNPKNPYAALWLDICNRRSDIPSVLLEATRQIDMNNWPVPIIRLYLGQLTTEAVLAAVDDPDASIKKGHVCELKFFSGQLALQRGDKNEAMRLFNLSVDECPKAFIEYEGANAELKALGQTP